MAKKGTGVGLEKQNESSWRLAGLSPHKNMWCLRRDTAGENIDFSWPGQIWDFGLVYIHVIFYTAIKKISK